MNKGKEEVVSEDFKDLVEKPKKGYIPVVILLYIVVIIIFIFLIYGINNIKTVPRENNNISYVGR